VRAIGDAIEAGKQGVTPRDFEQNGQREPEPAPEPEPEPAADETPVEHEPMGRAESAAESEAVETPTEDPEAAGREGEAQ
jgi:hypothetical protein